MVLPTAPLFLANIDAAKTAAWPSGICNRRTEHENLDGLRIEFK